MSRTEEVPGRASGEGHEDGCGSATGSIDEGGSLVVVPGRWPSSISACRTQFRNVSGWIPSCSPTRRNAPRCEKADADFRIAFARRSSRFSFSSSSSRWGRMCTSSSSSRIVRLEGGRVLNP